MPTNMHLDPTTIFHNIWIAAGLFGWFVAQLSKLISFFLKTHRVRLTYFVSTGGMPSAHSASVAAVATSVGLTDGFDSSLFAIAFTVAVITMFDAATLRLNAGHQARLLNQISRELFQNRRIAQKPLKELLGHTRFEVFMGMFVGIASGALMTLWMSPLLPSSCP